MADWFDAQGPVLQALLAGLFTRGLTALGAAVVFGFVDMQRRWLDAMLGFAGRSSRRACASMAAWQRSILLVTAITLHNIPEGLAVALSLRGAAVVVYAAPLLPFALSFAAGAILPRGPWCTWSWKN